METHGIHPGEIRKADKSELPLEGAVQIQCSDCGHVYLIEQGQRSSACAVCGNVAFHADSLKALSKEILTRRVLPRLETKENKDPLAALRVAPDGNAVEQIRMQYQVEWQLWAKLTQNFGDPAYHMAYITAAMLEDRIEQAADRYREHRSVMTLLDDVRWQADAADLMLARIESLSIARMPSSRGDYGYDLPAFLKLLPYDSRVTKVAWIAFGVFVAAKLLHFASIHP